MQKEVYDFNRKMQQEIYYGFREKIESKKKRKKYSIAHTKTVKHSTTYFGKNDNSTGKKSYFSFLADYSTRHYL